MPTTPQLSICVLTYNGERLLPDCLASIDSQEIPCEHEKLIVDNGSDNPVVAPVGWRVVRLEKNRGNIGGENACFEASKGQWVLFVANDIRLRRFFFRYILDTHPGDIYQPKLLQPTLEVDNIGLIWVWPGYGTSSIYGDETNSFSGSCFLMEKATWEDVGRFDESLISSHEDIDFSIRAWRNGYHIITNKHATAIHLMNQTLRHTIQNPRQVFHDARIKVVTKHYRGLDRLTRLAAIHILDRLPR